MLGFDLNSISNSIKTQLEPFVAEARAGFNSLLDRLDRIIVQNAETQRLIRCRGVGNTESIDPLGVGVDPNRFPEILSLAGGQSIDAQILLSRSVGAGFAENIGDATCTVKFGKRGVERTITKTLTPGARLDFAFIWDTIEVAETGEGPVQVEVVAQ